MAPSSNLIGVCICIAGNTCISLALNVQKLAHLRIENPKYQSSDIEASSSVLSNSESQPLSNSRQPVESSPLLSNSTPQYSASTASHPSRALPLRAQSHSQTPDSRGVAPAHPNRSPSASKHTKYVPLHGDSYPRQPSNSNDYSHDLMSSLKPQNEESTTAQFKGTYLHSKLWWSGLALMALGETGNFLSYGFAPASLVAPLGTVALMANCFFTPLLLKERFRKRDLAGILLCLVGAITVVYSSEGRNKLLDPDQFLEAISQPVFTTYTIVCVVLAILLAIASHTKLGEDYIVVDLGLCAILGAFTVLSTKAFASFLNELFLKTFEYWITYPILGVLISTAVAQVAFLNKALQRFDAKHVVPTQYVFFTISTIVGSAILYQEFEQLSFDKVLNFFLGCLTVFVGVYVLTTLSPSDVDDVDVSEESGTYVAENTPQKSSAFTTPNKKGIYATRMPLSSAQTISSTAPLSASVSRQRSLSMLRAAASRPKSAGYLLIASSPHDPSESNSRRGSITENDDQVQYTPRVTSARRPSSSLRTESRMHSALRTDSETSNDLYEESE